MKTVVALLMLVFFAVPAFAETYIWEDDQGTTNFADDLSKIPKKYRKKAKIVGEEETPPAEGQDGKDKPAVERQKATAPAGTEGASPAPKADAKAVYGGKDAATWKYEFASARSNLKFVEDQLTDTRNRLKDTSGMSRSEFLSLQNTVKALERSVLVQQNKLNDLKQEAEKAGVPAELMQ